MNADGTKLREHISTGVSHDYLGAFFYKDDELLHFAHENGRSLVLTDNPTGQAFRYEYNLTDHLGNVRVSFSDVNFSGSLFDENTGELEEGEVLQSEHFYPFGMRMGGLSSPISGTENRYRYNGKELNTELGLNWYDYGFRWYDPSIARFVSVDPLAEDFVYLTPYQYASNTPIQAIDLDGLEAFYVNPNAGEEGSIDNGTFAGFLSLITGRQVTIADQTTSITLPGGSTVEGYQINISDQEFAGGAGFPGFGGELRKLLEKTNVQVGIQLSDISQPFAGYNSRGANPLTLDSKLFNGQLNPSPLFLAHVITHELAETFSLSEEVLINGKDFDYRRDHMAASLIDIKAARQIMDGRAMFFDTGTETRKPKREVIRNAGDIFTDVESRTWITEYTRNARNRITDVIFRFFPQYDYQTGNFSREQVLPLNAPRTRRRRISLPIGN